MSGPTTSDDAMDYSAFLGDMPPGMENVNMRGPPPTKDQLSSAPELTLSAEEEKELEKYVGGSLRKKTMKNSTSGGDIVSVLLTIRNQVKLYHWQTKSFADHKATDDLTAALDTAIDTFVEVYMGKYGRPRVSKTIKLHNFSSTMARSFVSKQTLYLINVLPRKLKKTDTDLLNIRDEILAELNKIRYLFTLQ